MRHEASLFIRSFNALAREALDISISKGWDQLGNDGEKIALMHSELSEALEGLRHGDPQSEKIPPFSNVEEELSDVIIRIMIFCNARRLRVAEALVEKSEYNKSRPHMHGGKLF